MSLQDRITEAAGTAMEFLAPSCDKFLLGFCCQGGSTKPFSCYGYQAAKACMIDNYIDPDRAYAELSSLMTASASSDVVWLYRYSRPVLWDIINREQYKRWESLDRAVIGLGFIHGDPIGIIYNKALCVDIISDDTASSSETMHLGKLDAIEFVDRSIAGLYIGELTPWFLTHVK